jgi:subtilase family serine protease
MSPAASLSRMKTLPIPQSDVSRPLPPFESAPEPRHEAKSRVKALIAALAVGLAAGCAANSGSVAPASHTVSSGPRDGQNISRALPAASPTPFPAAQAGCGPGLLGGALCGVLKAAKGPTNTPSGGLTPQQLRVAYGLSSTWSMAVPTGPLVAVVVAFNNPNADDDLNAYRSQFGLPACTAKNGCFQVVQIKPTPGNPPPAPAPPGQSADATTWSDEAALDLAMVSAACPNCRILLVQAFGQDLDSLANAVNVAASYNPAAISNSWGVPEGGGNAPNIDAPAQAAFNHPGIAITASAGDLGSGAVQFPASSPYVTSVGGTSLAANAGSARGWTEIAWSGTGSGCSIMIAVPAWQGANQSCSGARTIPDISMLADSTTGVAVYSKDDSGWIQLGGTSLGAPFIAGLYAAAGDYGAATVGAPLLYANLGNLNAVPGTNGSPNGLTGF